MADAQALTDKRSQSVGEEIANSISHGIGVFLGAAALVILVVIAAVEKDPWGIVGFSVYGASFILLFINSTMYHSITHSKAKHVLQILDHSAIFLLIAGTYTPICLTAMRGPWGFTLFGLNWSFAILGIVLQTVRFGKYPRLTTALYIAMGWLIVIAVKPMMRMIPQEGQIWLLAGGLAYTIGVVFYNLSSRIRYFHFIWHIFVLAGAVSHFFAMLAIYR